MNERPQFLMGIAEAFDIVGKGIVIIGQVSEGIINIGDIIEMMNETGLYTGNAKVIGIEQSQKQLEFAQKDDCIGLVLEGTDKQTCTNSIIAIVRSEHLVMKTLANLLNISLD